MEYEWPGFLLVFVFGFVFASGPLAYVFPTRMRNLIVLAFLVRAVGTLLRHWVIFEYYEGGDAVGYYRFGVSYAESIWNLDFSFLQPSEWQYGHWWGTQGVMIISGFVVSLIGPTVRGEFLVFSLLSLCGFLLFCRSFQRYFPNSDARKYAMWVLLWPSLWFWSSSVGKDALILFTSGLVVYGYCGKDEKIQWIPLLIGLTMAALIRPHVAGVMVVSVAIAHWITPGKRWTGGHWVQGFGIIAITILVVQYGFSNLGIEDIDVDSIKEYVEYVSGQSAQGGSEIEAPGLSVTGIPLAFVNILFRPFPWEVSNPLVAAASLEMTIFWIVIWSRRKRIRQVIGRWRYNRMLRLALPLTLLYILMLGLAVSNLGIIARQRIHIMPLLFIWLEALPAAAAVRQQAKAGPSSLRPLPGSPAPSLPELGVSKD